MSSLFRVVSTFSGCGGSSLGYRLAGGEVLLAVEWDDNAAATYKANFPGTPVYHGDIANLTVEECLRLAGLQAGELDILDGSPPCQGFSTAGERRFGDERNQLFREYVRLLRGLQPRAFVMENVSGMVKGKMKVLFAEILRELRACGYRVSARLLNAAWFGVPQARERLIFIGVREDLGVEPSHPRPRGRPQTAREALEGVAAGDPPCMLSGLALKVWLKTPPGGSFDKHHPKGHWFNAAKLDPNKPAPTITKTVFPRGQGGIFHWRYPRILTIPELKRLSTFPDDFQFFGKFREQWARIGNAVPPNFMRAIAEHVYRYILSRV
ncbi:MAG: DNA cytosine methyltransferase [Patescibacteria group bacterium]